MPAPKLALVATLLEQEYQRLMQTLPSRLRFDTTVKGATSPNMWQELIDAHPDQPALRELKYVWSALDDIRQILFRRQNPDPVLPKFAKVRPYTETPE
jgi:hypothetical protein